MWEGGERTLIGDDKKLPSICSLQEGPADCRPAPALRLAETWSRPFLMWPVGLRKPPKTGWTRWVFRTEILGFSVLSSRAYRDEGKTATSSENCIGWWSCLSLLASLHVRAMDKIGSGIMTNCGHYNAIIQHYDSILSNYLLNCSQWPALPHTRWMSRPQTINWVEIIKIRHLMPQKIYHKKEFTSAAACDYECSTL